MNPSGCALSAAACTYTGSATINGTASLGAGSTNWIQISGAASNPQIAVAGGGTNGALLLRSQGTGSVNIGSATGSNILQLASAASATDTLVMTQPSATGNAFAMTATQGTSSGGLNFNLPIEFNRNITYSGLFSSAVNQWPFNASSTISGTSANTSQYQTGLIVRTFNGFQSGQSSFGMNFHDIIAAGADVKGDSPIFVNISETGQPGAITAWGSGQSIATTGTLRSNAGVLYQSTNTGTTGASAPTCGPGASCSDGTVSWQGSDILANAIYTVAIAQQANISYNAGGTSGAPIGSNFGANLAASLLCPSTAPNCATYYNQNVGVEIDDIIASGASAYRDATIQLVKEGAQGLAQDWGVSFAASGGSASPWLNPIILQSAIDGTSGIGIAVSNQGGGNGITQSMAGFIDCILCQATGQVTGAGGSLNVGGGGYVLRSQLSNWLYTGDVALGNALFHIGSQSLTLDVGQYVLTAVGAADGTGANWPTTSQGSDDQGNIFTVAATAGVPTSATILYKTTMSACPAGAQAIHALAVNGSIKTSTGGGTFPTNFNVASETCQQGTTLNIGTTTATTIGIGNSGSTTTINGTIKAGSGTGKSQTCTVNTASALTLIFTNGILTGGTCNS